MGSERKGLIPLEVRSIARDALHKLTAACRECDPDPNIHPIGIVVDLGSESEEVHVLFSHPEGMSPKQVAVLLGEALDVLRDVELWDE